MKKKKFTAEVLKKISDSRKGHATIITAEQMTSCCGIQEARGLRVVEDRPLFYGLANVALMTYEEDDLEGDYIVKPVCQQIIFTDVADSPKWAFVKKHAHKGPKTLNANSGNYVRHYTVTLYTFKKMAKELGLWE